LQLALAESLRDPSLEVAYWLPDKGIFVDANGVPTEPERQAGRAVHMLEKDGERIAALILDPALQDEPGLVQSVGAAARLALENERLHAQVLAQLDEVRAQRLRLLDIGYEARRKIERDLHDGAQQRFLAVLIGLRAAQIRGTDEELRVELERVAGELKGAIDELRDLVHGIYPPILAAQGLRAALVTLAERTPLPVALAVPERRYPERVESTAYFVVSESLTNVAKYAHASRAEIALAEAAGSLVVRVSDDGRGGADPAQGSGLQGLIERVRALEGRVHIDSPPGGGTRVVAEIPCTTGAPRPEPPRDGGTPESVLPFPDERGRSLR
jgi:signal transduction histidine kinase